MNEDRINKIAMSRGVAAAEQEALKAERRARMRPVKVTHEGLQGADHKHVLVHGKRSFAGVVRGLTLYDPVQDEVALVIPEGDGAWVRVGSLEVREVLGKRGWDKVLVGAVDYARDAPGDYVPVVSNWLVRRVAEAADTALQRSSVSGTRDAIVRLDPQAIWRVLGDNWVAEPWGIPLPPRALGGSV